MKLLKENFLLLVVFLTGAGVLVVEVVAARILSPYFGNTIYTYSSVISVILAALSIGYYLGGKLSDQKATLKVFFGLITLSGLLILVFHLLSVVVLPYLGSLLPISYGPLIVSTLLFFTPAVFLGMISPYSIKIQNLINPNEGIGTLTGKIFFWSTFGSIFGSLFAGFVLIPTFGVSTIMFYTGVFLFLLGTIPTFLLKTGTNSNTIVLGLVLFAIGIFSVNFNSQNLVFSKDGLYENLAVYDVTSDDGRPVRVFRQDKSVSSAMYLDEKDPTDLVLPYSKYYDLYKYANSEPNYIYIIGGGTYSLPKVYAYENPNSIVQAIDIEDELIDISARYFNLDGRFTNIVPLTGDGRNYLYKSTKHYDLIFGDAYGSIYSIPSHLVTKEFFELVKSRLSKDGVFIANIIGNLDKSKSEFLTAEMATFKAVFPSSYFLATESTMSKDHQNFIFIGFVGNFDEESFLKDPKVADRVVNFTTSETRILTDDFAPVDYLVGKSL